MTFGSFPATTIGDMSGHGGHRSLALIGMVALLGCEGREPAIVDAALDAGSSFIVDIEVVADPAFAGSALVQFETKKFPFAATNFGMALAVVRIEAPSFQSWLDLQRRSESDPSEHLVVLRNEIEAGRTPLFPEDCEDFHSTLGRVRGELFQSVFGSSFVVSCHSCRYDAGDLKTCIN